ncbi:hypothetical protein Q4575_05330 [Psychrosphaera sp. 1_MG-2023]|uniref:hypothetical protein n=1 Tax=Psychrosphaera sp. 1_MG-2023 TaxID=3062643 RepID=UPI0026E2BF64|nr:hypothetical protein [Psychrosphaera sp. 1_MG-2023]MDO6718812.1 hypothetical protein [Psychrosphaera sp. 1_MG-2023]
MKLVIIFIALVLSGCGATSSNTVPAKMAVIPVEELKCVECRPLQSKYHAELVNIASNTPYSMGVKSLGFRERKGLEYISIDLIGSRYNTIQTTTISRLSNEVFSKYSDMTKRLLNTPFKDDIDGVFLAILVTSNNFVSDPYPRDLNNEIIEIYSSKESLTKFHDGDITLQDALDQSQIFVNGQRMNFELKMI